MRPAQENSLAVAPLQSTVPLMFLLTVILTAPGEGEVSFGIYQEVCGRIGLEGTFKTPKTMPCIWSFTLPRLISKKQAVSLTHGNLTLQFIS